MFSLYRAWLSMTPGCGIPSDLQLRPPSPNLSGAPDVTLLVGPTLTHFSAHKRIISFHSGFFKAALANHSGYEPVPVPNVNVDEFSSLLTFMYTGFLDLNFTNIYSILLATHILHMPSAMEICRSFLLQNQPTETRTNVIKPIPSRKAIMPLQSVIHPPLYGTLRQSSDTSFKPLTEENQLKNAQAKNKDPVKPEEENNKDLNKKIMNKTFTVNSENSSEIPVNIEKKLLKNKKKCLVATEEKYEIDVACCDGPVRFHKVLNKNFGKLPFDSKQKCQPHIPPANRNEAINRIMTENIREQNREDINDTGDFSGEIFKCMYCNHTFKSQYCYQKHAQRHLNPVLESKIMKKAETFTNNKREVKLLDLNVQYYPCKLCGSKFPSYYFVHKHRKICHSTENDNAIVTTTEDEQKSETKENKFKNNDNETENETQKDQ